jgi:hypothetical protein
MKCCFEKSLVEDVSCNYLHQSIIELNVLTKKCNPTNVADFFIINSLFFQLHLSPSFILNLKAEPLFYFCIHFFVRCHKSFVKFSMKCARIFLQDLFTVIQADNLEYGVFAHGVYKHYEFSKGVKVQKTGDF